MLPLISCGQFDFLPYLQSRKQQKIESRRYHGRKVVKLCANTSDALVNVRSIQIQKPDDRHILFEKNECEQKEDNVIEEFLSLHPERKIIEKRIPNFSNSFSNFECSLSMIPTFHMDEFDLFNAGQNMFQLLYSLEKCQVEFDDTILILKYILWLIFVIVDICTTTIYRILS